MNNLVDKEKKEDSGNRQVKRKKSVLSQKLEDGCTKMDNHIYNVEQIGTDVEAKLISMFQDIKIALRKCKDLQSQSDLLGKRMLMADEALKIKDCWTQTEKKYADGEDGDEEAEGEECFHENIFTSATENSISKSGN